MATRDPRWPSDRDPEDEFDSFHPQTSGQFPVVRPQRRRTSTFQRRLESVLLVAATAVLGGSAWSLAHLNTDEPAPALAPVAHGTAASDCASTPRIQVAILLDTSSSMDGLIDQARGQLWAVVNALGSAEFHGREAKLEIAIFEYGNDHLRADRGYIRQVTPFTTELDAVSEGLFGLTTNGGDEFAGQAIEHAVTDLAWSGGDDVFRVLYIAGNEEFTQGPTHYAAAVAYAREQGIVVNTINCTGGGEPDEGWVHAAEIGGGKALTIDQSLVKAYVETPQDDAIERVSTELNETYVGYGSNREQGIQRQVAQDSNTARLGRASSISRALSKGSRHYDNASWDLIDATDQGIVDLSAIDRSTLDDDLREVSDEQLEQTIRDKASARARLMNELRELEKDRKAYLQEHQSEDAARLDVVMIESLGEQAAAAGFTL